MPILDIEVVMGPKDELPRDAAPTIADRAGEVLGSEPGRTWVKVRALPENQYAENGGVAAGVKPVFISVLLREPSSPKDKQGWAKALAEAAAPVFGRQEGNIHVLFLSPGQGRIAFGGRLVE